MNEFESGARKLIPAVLIYAEIGGKYLMIHRGSSGDGFHQGKWNGLGGKIEADESPFEAAAREFREESGLSIPSARFAHRGTLLEEAIEANLTHREGDLKWILTSDIIKLNLWPGDLLFLQHVLAGETFSGTIWYRGSEVSRHEIRVM